MSEPVALGLTGLTLLIAAVVLAIASDTSVDYTTARRASTAGWVVFTLGLICVIGGIWWGVLA